MVPLPYSLEAVSETSPLSSGALERCPTVAGDAHIVLDGPARPVAVLLIGHGAAGGVETPDLLAVRDALVSDRVAVGRVLQPYRVAGRRAPDRAPRLDAAWLDVVRGVRARPGFADLPLVVGGRSSGARVACRTAAEAAAAGVVALAFPLVPPGRPGVSRVDELAAVARPTLVVQGDRDAFGGPDEVRAAVAAARGGGLPDWLRVVPVAGADHAFAARRVDGRTRAECVAEVAAAVRAFVGGLVSAAPAPGRRTRRAGRR